MRLTGPTYAKQIDPSYCTHRPRDICCLAGARAEGDPKVEVIIRTRGGASIYSWTFGFSVRCADTNRPLPPLGQVVPNDIAANLFNSVGTVEISEYREPNSPILTARQCPS